MEEEKRIITWCGYDWNAPMEGGRIIHPDDPYSWYSISMVNIKDNMATLDMMKNPRDIKYWDGKTYHREWECGRLRSLQDFSYGEFSADIMVPNGTDIKSAFWLVGNGKWPDSGEIDICEAQSNRKGSYLKPTIPQFPWLVPSWTTTYNVHWAELNGHCQKGMRYVPVVKQCYRPDENLVNYKVIWRINKLTFYVNGKKIDEYGWEVTRFLAGNRMNVIFQIGPDADKFKYTRKMVIKDFRYDEI